MSSAKCLPVHEDGHDIQVFQAPLSHLLQLRRAGHDEAARHRRGREPEAVGIQPRGLPVVAAAQPAQDPSEQRFVRGLRRLEHPIGLQRNLRPALLITDARRGHRNLLVEQVHGPVLLAPANQPVPAVLPAVPGTGELLELLQKHVPDLLQGDRDQRLDHLHPLPSRIRIRGSPLLLGRAGPWLSRHGIRRPGPSSRRRSRRASAGSPEAPAETQWRRDGPRPNGSARRQDHSRACRLLSREDASSV